MSGRGTPVIQRALCGDETALLQLFAGHRKAPVTRAFVVAALGAGPDSDVVDNERAGDRGLAVPGGQLQQRGLILAQCPLDNGRAPAAHYGPPLLPLAVPTVAGALLFCAIAGAAFPGTCPEPGGFSCTDTSPECFRRDQSLLATAFTTESGSKPCCTRTLITWDWSTWIFARSPASSRMNGTRASYHRVAPPEFSDATGEYRGGTMDCRHVAAEVQRCAKVPSAIRRRALSKFPAFRVDPCRPSENPTHDGGIPAAAASFVSPWDWLIASSISRRLFPTGTTSAPPPRYSVFHALKTPLCSSSISALICLTMSIPIAGSNLIARFGVLCVST